MIIYLTKHVNVAAQRDNFICSTAAASLMLVMINNEMLCLLSYLLYKYFILSYKAILKNKKKAGH